ncbi:unnamed protein product [Lactuca saligna]|uniref:Uncharacterized protein n=1 Tax=Lactuca saligna TaxID=75948 RepID=A0AA36E453_LACSI|nr:unnamed protein product [Lactuca saligna]
MIHDQNHFPSTKIKTIDSKYTLVDTRKHHSRFHENKNSNCRWKGINLQNHVSKINGDGRQRLCGDWPVVRVVVEGCRSSKMHNLRPTCKFPSFLCRYLGGSLSLALLDLFLFFSDMDSKKQSENLKNIEPQYANYLKAKYFSDKDIYGAGYLYVVSVR